MGNYIFVNIMNVVVNFFFNVKIYFGFMIIERIKKFLLWYIFNF